MYTFLIRKYLLKIIYNQVWGKCLEEDTLILLKGCQIYTLLEENIRRVARMIKFLYTFEHALED